MLENSAFYASFAVDDLAKGDDIETTVDELRNAGLAFEQYDSGPIKTNEKGIATPGPKQAWFKDPAGNVLSVLEG